MLRDTTVSLLLCFVYQVQRCRRFGSYGIVVCSSTRLEDIPFADTFSGDDIMTVSHE